MDFGLAFWEESLCIIESGYSMHARRLLRHSAYASSLASETVVSGFGYTAGKKT